MKKVILALSLVGTIGFAKEKVVVFHAGSLAVPFSSMEKAFEAKYPQYQEVERVLEKLQIFINLQMLWYLRHIKS